MFDRVMRIFRAGVIVEMQIHRLAYVTDAR